MTRFTCHHVRRSLNFPTWLSFRLGPLTHTRYVPKVHPSIFGGVVRILFRTMNVSLFTKDIIVHIELGLHTCFLQVIL
ncbi:unnamed protein product [Sphagnum jensenii]|uniref:Uncharacterized protein n=1 Tax=Sphagnum jensenii TaxID=128206 RepID=A0ABP1BMU4_9BRYO